MKRTQKAWIVLTVCTLMAPPALGAWQVETVTSTGSISGRSSLELDSSSRPHVAYDTGAGHWEYAYHDGAAWNTEVVTTEGSGPGLDLDGGDHPHVAYSFWSGMDLLIRYAFHDGSTWQIETVDTGWIGSSAPMAVDGSDEAHTCYSRFTTVTELVHAERLGGTWIAEVARLPPFVESEMAMALDGSDDAHIVHVATAGWHDMDLASENAGAWSTESVDGRRSTMDYALCMDAAGYPRVAYPDEDAPQLAYSYKDAGGWHYEVIDPGGGMHVAMTLDPAGTPHVSYQAMGSPDMELRYARRTAGGWQVDTVASGPNLGRGSSLRIDPGGYACITFYDEFTGELKYAHGTTPDVPAITPMGLMILLLGCSLLLRRRRQR